MPRLSGVASCLAGEGVTANGESLGEENGRWGGWCAPDGLVHYMMWVFWCGWQPEEGRIINFRNHESCLLFHRIIDMHCQLPSGLALITFLIVSQKHKCQSAESNSRWAHPYQRQSILRKKIFNNDNPQLIKSPDL